MKIEIKDAPPTTEEDRFPVIAKNKNSNAVWLFVKKDAGIFLGDIDQPKRKVGRFWDCSVIPIDSGEWEILPPGTQVIFTQGMQ